LYPPESLSEQDLTTICFNSFPERHDTDVADMFFSFTTRNTSHVKTPTDAVRSADPSVLHGVSVFRQVFDPMSKRRFDQKSLVIISSHNFTSLFMNVIRIISNAAAIGDPTLLETACTHIAAWPDPAVGRLDLHFMEAKIELEMCVRLCNPWSLMSSRAPYPSFPLQGLTSTNATSPSVAAFEPPMGWQRLLPLLHSPSILYVLYERLLLGSPVIVLGQNPDQVSGLVLALVDLIRPIPFSGTTRPYLPMQSTSTGGDLALFDPSSPQSQSMLVGITNPFLLQRLDSSAPSPSHPLILTLDPANAEASTLRSHRLFRHAPPRLRRHSDSAPGAPRTGRQTATEHLRPSSIRPDRAFLHALSKPHGPGAPDDVSGVVRRHFADLTARLLAPVNRHLATATPPPKEEDGHGQAFDTLAFLASLKRHDVAVPFVGRTRALRSRHRDAFYAALVAGCGFRDWLEIRALGMGAEDGAG
jgi:hypothetical protein